MSVGLVEGNADGSTVGMLDCVGSIVGSEEVATIGRSEGKAEFEMDGVVKEGVFDGMAVGSIVG